MRFLLICLLLAGCGSDVVTNTVIQKDVPVTLPKAQPLTLNNVQFQVLTLDELKSLVIKLQTAQKNDTILFVLDTTDYTNLQLNLVDIQRYIKEQKAILDMANNILNQRSNNKTDK